MRSTLDDSDDNFDLSEPEPFCDQSAHLTAGGAFEEEPVLPFAEPMSPALSYIAALLARISGQCYDGILNANPLFRRALGKADTRENNHSTMASDDHMHHTSLCGNLINSDNNTNYNATHTHTRPEKLVFLINDPQATRIKDTESCDLESEANDSFIHQ